MAPIQADDLISAVGKGLMVGMAPWVSVEWKPIPRLTIVPSLRADFYLGSWQAWTIDPRLSVTVDVVPDKLNFRFAGGLYSQPAPPYAYTKEFGNPNIKPEYAVHVLAGFEYTPIDRLTLSANGFYKYFFNRVQTSEDRTLIYDNKTTGRAYGCDILLRMNPGGSIPLTGWIAYTYLRAEIYDRVTGTYRPSNFQQSHNLNIFINYKLPKNWSLGARFRLSSGYPYTKNDGFVYDSDNDNYISIPSDNVNGEELPLFHQLDIRIDKEWIFNKWKLGLYLEVQNVYFHKNPEGLMNNYDYSKTGYLSGIPILPVLGIKGSF
jgi:outer membrane receptor protein involved in Fe transport